MALSFSISATIFPPNQEESKFKNRKTAKGIENARNLVKTSRVLSLATSPHESLQKGNWVKLICGASFEDVVDIRNLSMVYTLAGVDCIDCAADAAVVSAVNEGIDAAMEVVELRRPWVMISVNDDDDLHFRKAVIAEFDPDDCPMDCSRPCELVCPANAIKLDDHGGVITERCYGCGRCFPVCPYDKIREVTYIRDVATTSELLRRSDVDAIEIHTSGRQDLILQFCLWKTKKKKNYCDVCNVINLCDVCRQTDPFKELWDGLRNSTECMKLVAISLPYTGDSTMSVMNEMHSIMEPHLKCLNLWQVC
ncbi:unnamed protein product [Linum tenue]|uniref:4Fe-4S ferredoxin-type domain-containing protein n=1 Tax=Linum tenue TaxID=586396 RepID=A0AAV0S3F1_9ROSI|nr:unnamed protein product [Linum tenue]